TDAGFYRGLSDLLTVYGRELNVDSTGQPRTYVNDTDMVTLNQNLSLAVGQAMADYIVAYRMYSTSTVGGGGGGNRITGGPNELRAAVQQSLSGSSAPRSQRTVKNSVLSLLNTQVTLPRPANARPTDPDTVVPCPLNGTDAFKQMLPAILDK